LMSSSAFPTSQVADYHLPLAGKTTFLLTVASVFPKLSSPKPLQSLRSRSPGENYPLEQAAPIILMFEALILEHIPKVLRLDTGHFS
jgi:hypothetical protein